MSKPAISAAKHTAASIRSALSNTGSVGGGGSSGGSGAGRAQGGLMSFAPGGMLTAVGRQQVTVGDNPGGHETVAFVPHNNPMPTLEKLFEMFFKGGSVQMGNGKEVIINVSLNIHGNEIVDQRRIIRRVKADLGANRWRFGG